MSLSLRHWVIAWCGVLLPALAFTQDGGDQDGMLGKGYDRLYTSTGMLGAARSSKALGVYNASMQPKALLEVNANPSHYKWLHPNLSSRGELFRTSAPADVTANWRFLQGGSELGRLWSFRHDKDLHIRAPKGALRFWASDTDPAAFQVETMRIWGSKENGGVSINEDNGVQAMPRIALLNLGTYVGKGQRSWMENGLFAGVASDGLYLGMKQEDGDHNDAVLGWNDNADPIYRDHLRFLFTQKRDAGTAAAGSNGLEMARFDPGEGQERNAIGADPSNAGLGIGNFYVPSGPDDPVTARLDVRRGDVRIRELPRRRDPRADRVVVVRPNGILRVRDASSFCPRASAIDSLEKVLRKRTKRFDRLQKRLDALEDSLSTLRTDHKTRDAEGWEFRSDHKTLLEGTSKLGPNRPNPFQDRTTFSYELAERAQVEFFISDQKGRRVVTLLDQHQEAGSYQLRWDASGVGPGIYLYTLRVDGVERVRKAIKME